jgi:regulator of sirC expression with transglutaminase-like and TPR domain
MAGREKIQASLRQAGEAPDQDIDIAEMALLLAALDRPGVSLGRYRDHLNLIADGLAGAAAGMDSLDERVAALNEAVFIAYGYEGDRRAYDDLQNANLIRVIDRRRGLPVALGILMIQTARAQGWDIAGLRFPGHFLLRMDHRGQRAILDPFEKGEPKSAADLRILLRAQGDEEAELNPEHYEAASDREVLVRLQNNVKFRQTQRGDNLAAATTLDTMLWIAPQDKNLWREKALLAAQLGRIDGAVAALEEYILRETLDGPRHDAALLLQKLRGQEA